MQFDSEDNDVLVISIPAITLRWSSWVPWPRVALDVKKGGISPPNNPGVYEVRNQRNDERLTIGKAANLRMRVKQALVKGRAPHAAGEKIRAREDTTQAVIRWAETMRPAAAEEELHLQHIACFGHLPKYTGFT